MKPEVNPCLSAFFDLSESEIGPSSSHLPSAHACRLMGSLSRARSPPGNAMEARNGPVSQSSAKL